MAAGCGSRGGGGHHGLYRQTLPGFVERYGPSLAADEVAIIQRWARPAIRRFMQNFPRCSRWSMWITDWTI